MTAKEYLNQARHLDALINSRLREIDYWKDLAHGVTGSGFEAHYNSNRTTEASFVLCIEKIAEIQQSVEEKVAHFIQLRDEMNRQIDMLDSREEQTLLRYRYIDGFTWEEVAMLLNVSVRTVHRIHGAALQNFIVPD